MDEDLDRHLRSHFRGVAAPEAVRARLVALAVDRRRARRRLRWSLAAGLAAAVLVAGLSVAALQPGTWAGPGEIAAAVAAHHLHAKPSDVVSPRIEDIAAALPRLDFALVLPRRGDLPAWRVEGGRYCSIAGTIAAQLRLVDAEGTLHTLYVSRSAGALERIHDFTAAVDPVQVRLWREGGLSYAWATVPAH